MQVGWTTDGVGVEQVKATSSPSGSFDDASRVACGTVSASVLARASENRGERGKRDGGEEWVASSWVKETFGA